MRLFLYIWVALSDVLYLVEATICQKCKKKYQPNVICLQYRRLVRMFIYTFWPFMVSLIYITDPFDPCRWDRDTGGSWDWLWSYWPGQRTTSTLSGRKLKTDLLLPKGKKNQFMYLKNNSGYKIWKCQPTTKLLS